MLFLSDGYCVSNETMLYYLKVGYGMYESISMPF